MDFRNAVNELLEIGVDGDYIVASCLGDDLVRITKDSNSLLASGSEFQLSRMTELSYDVHATKKLTFHEALEAVLIEGKTVRATDWTSGYELRPNKHSGMTLYCDGVKSQEGFNHGDASLVYEVVK